MSESSRMLRLFLFALTIRWSLAIVLFITMGNDGLLGADSRGFSKLISNYAESIRAGSIYSLDWMGPNISLLPVPSWLWTVNALLFDNYFILTSVLCQSILDSASCIFIYSIASSINPRYALPAGIAAAVNPTQIVMSNLFYTDTIFLFFVVLTLYSAIRFTLVPAWRPAILLGLGVGGATLSRVLIVPWAGCLFLYLATLLIIQHRFLSSNFFKLGTAILIAGICTGTIVVRNYIDSGIRTLTPQTASHAAFWIAPLVMQANDGTSWERGGEMVRRRIEETYGPDSNNQAENLRRQSQVAGEILRELGIAAVAKAWLYGIAINIGAPAVTIAPPLERLPRTGFYSTPGNSLPEKIFNYLFYSENKLYAWLIQISIIGLLVSRFVQAIGMITLTRDHRFSQIIMLLASWLVYILLVNGPIASPKYRLPIEPVLMILTAAGYCTWRDKFRDTA
jgi:hypothetical protein